MRIALGPSLELDCAGILPQPIVHVAPLRLDARSIMVVLVPVLEIGRGRYLVRGYGKDQVVQDRATDEYAGSCIQSLDEASGEPVWVQSAAVLVEFEIPIAVRVILVEAPLPIC